MGGYSPVNLLSQNRRSGTRCIGLDNLDSEGVAGGVALIDKLWYFCIELERGRVQVGSAHRQV